MNPEDADGEDALFDAPTPAGAAGRAAGRAVSNVNLPAGTLGAPVHASQPLAVRMRPTSLDELVGQQHLRQPGSPLRQLVESDQAMGVILWGPPGSGKTTIAGIVSHQTDRRFVELSAVSAGVKEVRAVLDESRRELSRSGTETVLFVDEVHRFSKTQQDALLPGVENRWVTLIAATTENPFFSIISPLLSRSLLLTLEPLTDDDITEVVDRALTDDRGLGGSIAMTAHAHGDLVRLAGGDARRALTYLEAGRRGARPQDHRAGLADPGSGGRPRGRPLRPRRRPALRRRQRASSSRSAAPTSTPALHYLARMLEAGEDPRFIARRLVILASEDVGMADPTAC